MSVELTSISHVVAHALRHEPWLYELELDDEGWVPVEDLLASLRVERVAWCGLTEMDLSRMIQTSAKRRYELQNGRIRALYGHSVPGKLEKVAAVPPDVLFHGTAPSTVERIKQSGLLPMRRQYVHLSIDPTMATEVGRRKAGRPVILRVLAGQAHEHGVCFYVGNEKVWLADQVPAEFVVENELSVST